MITLSIYLPPIFIFLPVCLVENSFSFFIKNSLLFLYLKEFPSSNLYLSYFFTHL